MGETNHPTPVSESGPRPASETRVHWFDTQVRNRALVVLALVMLTPLALEAIDLPVRHLAFSVFGSAIGITLGSKAILVSALPALTCAGVDWLLRDHPDVRQGEVPFLFPFWIAPGFAALALALALTRIGSWPLWVAALILGVIGIGAITLSEWFTVSPATPGYSLSRLMLTVGVYATAFALFTLIYTTRERSIINATLVTGVAFCLTLDLVAPHIIGLKSALVQGLAVGVIMGQATWALNYWNISNWSAGVILLTMFYVMVGLAQQHFQDRLSRSVLFEFGGVAVIALVVAWQLSGVR